MSAVEGAAEKAKALVDLIGDRNFVTFAEIEASLGLGQFEVIFLKSQLEKLLEQQPGGLSHTIVTSCMDANPPGIFIED